MVIRKIKDASKRIFKRDWRARERAISIQHEVNEFRKFARSNYITLIISSFGLVAALTWNEAIKEIISTLVSAEGQLSAKIYSAVIVTIISIFVTYFLTKLKPADKELI